MVKGPLHMRGTMDMSWTCQKLSLQYTTNAYSLRNEIETRFMTVKLNLTSDH